MGPKLYNAKGGSKIKTKWDRIVEFAERKIVYSKKDWRDCG